MDLLQDLLDRLPLSTSTLTTEQGSQSDPVYKCSYCECTFGSRLDRCPECQIGQLERSGPEFESGLALTCRDCGTTVDYRYEHCPECGCAHFET